MNPFLRDIHLSTCASLSLWNRFWKPVIECLDLSVAPCLDTRGAPTRLLNLKTLQSNFTGFVQGLLIPSCTQELCTTACLLRSPTPDGMRCELFISTLVLYLRQAKRIRFSKSFSTVKLSSNCVIHLLYCFLLLIPFPVTPVSPLTSFSNDVYNIDECSREPVGGAPRFVTAIQHAINTSPVPTLVLFSGDAFSPSPLTPLTMGAEIPPILNATQIDVACIGT